MFAVLVEDLDDKSRSVVGLFDDLISAHDYIQDVRLNEGKWRSSVLEYTSKDAYAPSTEG